MGVVSYWWSSSANFSLMVRPYFAFKKSAPNSASTADDATNFNIFHLLGMSRGRNFLMHGSWSSLQTGGMRLNGCLISFLMHEI